MAWGNKGHKKIAGSFVLALGSPKGGKKLYHMESSEVDVPSVSHEENSRGQEMWNTKNEVIMKQDDASSFILMHSGFLLMRKPH